MQAMNQTEPPSDNDIKDDVLAVRESLGHIPTSIEYDQEGKFSLGTALYRLGGSWDSVLIEAGIDPESIPEGTQGNRRLPAEDLKEDLAAVAEALGHVPDVDEYIEYGEYSHSTILRHLGPYREALQKAGLDPNELPGGGKQGRPQTSKDKVLDDLARVGNEFYEEFGRRPSKVEYSERTELSTPTVVKHFDNDLGAGLDEAGVPGYGTGSKEPDRSRQGLDLDEETVINDFARVAEELGHIPTVAEYSKHGEYSSSTLTKYAGSYDERVEKAGLDDMDAGSRNLDEETVINDFARVAEELGHIPTVEEYDEHGKYSASSLTKHSGSYDERVEKAGLDPE